MCTVLCGTIKFSNKILNHSFKITCRCCMSLHTSPQCHFPIKHACKRRRTLGHMLDNSFYILVRRLPALSHAIGETTYCIQFMASNSGCTRTYMTIQQAASFTQKFLNRNAQNILYLHVLVRLYLSRQMVSAN